MADLTSAAGLVGLLSEPSIEIRSFALHRLNDEMDLLWPEVAGSANLIEALYEDESYPERELAALVAAKLFYQLQEYNESMVFALGAGKLFSIDHPGEFEDTIVAKLIDTYIALSALHNPPAPASTANQPPPQLTTAFPTNANGSANTAASLTSPTTPFSQTTLPSKSLLSRDYSPAFNPSIPGAGNSGTLGAHPSPLALSRLVQHRLHTVIRRLFEGCYQASEYQRVIGIAVEARNLDVLRETILRASQDERKNGKKSASGAPGKSGELMEYILDICMNVVQERGLRNMILRQILDLLNELPNPDYFSIAKCVVYLGQHCMASNMLRHLVCRGEAQFLAIAYQMSFDLYENSTQEFLTNVISGLPETDAQQTAQGAPPPPSTDNDTLRTEPGDETRETDGLLANAEGLHTATIPSRTKSTAITQEQQKAFLSIRHILEGTKTIELNLEFLYRNNRADRSVLNKTRDCLEARNSIFHTSLTFANAFMNSGTTNDGFFRDNLDWLQKAVTWSKFIATAALGVIHRGNITQGQRLLEPYLPKDSSVVSSTYSQGGSLYALGLIYSNHGTHVLDYLSDQFKRASDEVVQHGAALGLGVAGMATGNESIYDLLKGVLYTDSAINGGAVGLAMGLVMLGTGSIKALEDMIQYAHDTQHERIVRGLAVGMSLIMYGRQEAADELINGLLEDPDPNLRYGGIMTIALAYCGSSSNKAVRKLLHVAVSDVSDDVRRVAVLSLGFVLFRKPGAVPRMVELLAESYNPHVRYGATMALGIACAGTGLDEAVDLLEPMMKDSIDFVRQGALISLALIMVQQNESMNPKVATIRKTLQKAVGDRHEDAMAKFGAAIALGIIDAGGRNCTIGMQTQTGNLNMTAIVGMAIFTQYWYWFPLTHFLSLSFTPTAIIAVDQDLQVPSFKLYSATRPSVFDYPPEAEVKAEETPEKIKTAVLSTTAQAKRRKMVKERQQRRESMDVDPAPTTPKATNDDDKMETDEDGKNEEAKPGDDASSPATDVSRKKSEKEKVGYDLENMSRVLPAQVKHISFPGSRYVPIKKPTGGVIVVIDTKPSEAKELLELKVQNTSADPAPGAPGQSRVGNAGDGSTGHTTDQTTGTAEAAGVLTAIDEDEDGEEAPVPRDFDYHSDGDGAND